MEEAAEGLHGAYVGEEPEALAHGEEALLGADAGGGVVVILGVADGGEEDGVGLAADVVGVFGEGVAEGVDGCGAAEGLVVVDGVSELVTDGGHDVDSLAGYFGSDAVSGQYCDIQFHSVWVF